MGKTTRVSPGRGRPCRCPMICGKLKDIARGEEGSVLELTLGSGLRELPGIGEARASRLEKLGLATVEDLLRYFPRDYEDRRQRYTIAAAPVELPVCVAAMVAEPPAAPISARGWS